MRVMSVVPDAMVVEVDLMIHFRLGHFFHGLQLGRRFRIEVSGQLVQRKARYIPQITDLI